jgi:hypothetical protein
VYRVVAVRASVTVALSSALSFACFVACTSVREGRTALPDGSYQLRCRKTLADCLTDLADVCSANGYDVLRAKQERNIYGVEPVSTTYIDAEAIIRCRSASAVFVDDSPSARPVATAAAPVARCFPGTTQACFGPGACRGAQTCREDGARFGPCDCGGAPAPSEASDAGPPPTWAVPPDGGTPPDGGAPP